MLQVSILVQLIFNAREVNSFNKTFICIKEAPPSASEGYRGHSSQRPRGSTKLGWARLGGGVNYTSLIRITDKETAYTW